MSHRDTLIAALATVALITFGFAPQAWADPTDDLDTARATLTTLGDSMAQVEQDLSDKSNQLELTKDEISQTQDQINSLQTQLDQARATLGDRLSSSYKTGGTSLLDILLNSSSLDDMINKIYYLNKINQQDEATITQVTQLSEQLDAKQSELSQQQSDQETALAQSQQEYDDYQAKVAEAQAYVDQLDAEQQAALAAEAAATTTNADVQTGLAGALDATNNSGNAADGGADSNSGSTNGDSLTDAGGIVATAKQFVGYPYVSGGKGPNTFDCSGFTWYIYKLCGKNWKYATAAGQAAQISNKKYSVSELNPGDLIICHDFGHVGIYIGNNQMIHASTPTKGVIISDLTWYVNSGAFQFGGSPD